MNKNHMLTTWAVIIIYDHNLSLSLSEGVPDEEATTEEIESSKFTSILYQLVCMVN